MSKPLPSHDELVALLKSDPEAFEKQRQELIKEHIDAAPEEKKAGLLGIQTNVELRLAGIK